MSGESKLRQAPRRIASELGDTVRLGALLLLGPASRALPRRCALGLADAAGSAISLLPLGRRLRGWMGQTYPYAAHPEKLALAWLRQPLRDFVISARVAAGRERIVDWEIEMRNAPAILRQAGSTVIIVTGHFSRHAMGGLFTCAPGKNFVTVVAPIDRHAVGARALRIRVQIGQMLAGIARCFGDRVEAIAANGQSAALLLRRLKQPDALMVLAADIPWPKSRGDGYERPFAGHACQNFALGAARLSRLSQRPLVTCIPFLHDNKVVLEWGQLLPPAPTWDRVADERVTDLILNELEHAVGQRPGQYVLSIGRERQWHPHLGRWISEEDAAQVERREAESVSEAPGGPSVHAEN